MIEAEWWDYDSLDELADAVAGDVGFIIESAVDARNASLIAVPGGRTGPAIFPKLAAQKQQWKRVTIIPTDDRLVPMDSELANVREMARTFLPLGARVIPIATGIEDYKLAGNSADARLQDLPWPPDLVWLGMLGKMPVEAIDRQVQFAVLVPFDAEIILVERPVAGLCRLLVPGQALRLFEPEGVGGRVGTTVELGQFGRADAGIEAGRDGVDGFAHSPLLMSITKR